MSQDACKEVKARQEQDNAHKQQRRKDYDIGWDVKSIPRNDIHATRLAEKDVKQGMVCLMLQDGTNSVRIASTMDPSSAVNLEYLSVALRVRRDEGREAFFSLDPVTPGDMHTMQAKTFMPSWLAGTSVGDVLFEADYHLKELSMGECEQPVIGMKSCFEFSEMQGFSDDWKAREMFMVRKAEIQVSDDNTLVPYVKMGVEAREQVLGSNGLEDAPITRQDHPMAKYAEQFTHNFDLIAERKSVIFHLREYAKASIMAKFLLDSDMDLEQLWFELPCESEKPCSLEVPQLWNEQEESAIELKDGRIVHNGEIVKSGRGTSTARHGIYGGVDLGLTKFSLARGLESQLSTGMELTGMGAFMRSSDMRSRTVPTLLGQRRLQGVDMGLDQFDLSQPRKVALEAPYGSWCDAAQSLDSCTPVAQHFWRSIAEDSKVFRKEDSNLLRAIFNKSLSDRILEGELFAPPDASQPYVMKLRGLVKEEQEVQDKRKEHFFSKHFAMDSPGSLFPRSWSSLSEVTYLPDRVPHGSLHVNLDCNVEELNLACRGEAPVFERITEDGVTFRIYRIGSLEIRTIKELEGKELVGVVFSVRAPGLKSHPERSVREVETITKVTEFVERMQGSNNNEAYQQSHYYIVIETGQGSKIVSELTPSGRFVWYENPDELEDRNSLAKVTRTAERAAGVAVGEVKAYWQGMLQQPAPSASQSFRKQYARNVFNLISRRNQMQQNADESPISLQTAKPGSLSSTTNVTRASMRSAMWRKPFRC
jgi:hypothetical protein